MDRGFRGALRLVGVMVATLVLGAGSAWAAKVTLVLGGDIQWGGTGDRAGGIMMHPRPSHLERVLARTWGWPGERDLVLPHVFHDEAELVRKLGLKPLRRAKVHHELSFASEADRLRHPLLTIAPVLRQADIAFANLEMPLSEHGRMAGLQRDGKDSVFRGSPAFADVLAWAGVDVVSTANNHALDAGEQGLLDTRDNLLAAGVQPVGSGRNLDEARRPVVIERHGVRVAFLAYSMVDQSGQGYALRSRSGMAPLDPFLVIEDIAAAARQADHVAVSLHWGIEDRRAVTRSARQLAHSFIDAGADLVVGHHPHVPAAVEAYNGGVIFYSLGNFVFGHYRTAWTDNMLARVTLAEHGVAEAAVVPIAGTWAELARPAVLTGPRAATLLQDIAANSAEFGTKIDIAREVGFLALTAQSNLETGSTWQRLLAAVLLAFGTMGLLIAAWWLRRRWATGTMQPSPLG